MSDLHTDPVTSGGPLGVIPPVPAAAEPGALDAKKFSIGAWIAVAWLVLIIGGALLSPYLPISKPGTSSANLANLGPFRNMGHILGGDNLGRDMLARTLYGARLSLEISFGAILIGSVIGGFFGLLAGYYNGTWIDSILTPIFDAILAFPALILALALITFLKGGSTDVNSNAGKGLSGQTVLIIGLGLVSIPILARITKASTLSWSQREFVLAAKAQGAKSPRIMFREVLPNVLPALASLALLSIGVAIVAEGGLSILGAGIDPGPKTMTWGSMITESYGSLQQHPFPVFIPCAAMFLTVFALNYLGDAVRDYYDVRESAL